ASPAGFYVPDPAHPPILFARSTRTVNGLQYIPQGTFANDLLYTSSSSNEVWRLQINDADGSPVGGLGTMTPTETRSAPGFVAPPAGIEMDPVTQDDLFITTSDDTTPGNNTIIQIGGFKANFATTTTSTSTSTSTSSSSSSSTSTSSSTSSSTSTSS